MEPGEILILIGAVAVIGWGIAHIAATRPVVAGFESITIDNRRILTMEWVAEGLTLCLVGALALLATFVLGIDARGTALVNLTLAGFLALFTGLTLSTGARTPILPIKLCPLITTSVAALLIAGTVF
jgi:hypothetical protein